METLFYFSPPQNDWID